MATSEARETTANSVGFYTFPQMAIGDYRITVTAPGMTTWRGQVQVITGQTATVNATVALREHAVVDAFSAADAKGAEHQYDYVLHIDGQLENSSAALALASGKLGERCGYELVEQKRRGTLEGAFTLTFGRDGRQLRIWAPEGGATEVIVAEGLTNSPDRKMAMLVLRRKAARTRFLTVLEPVKPDAPLRAVRMEGGEVVLEFARGARRVPMQ